MTAQASNRAAFARIVVHQPWDWANDACRFFQYVKAFFNPGFVLEFGQFDGGTGTSKAFKNAEVARYKPMRCTVSTTPSSPNCDLLCE